MYVRYHEVQALRAVATHIPSPADPRYEATCSAAPSAAGWPDIQHGPSRVDSDDETLTHEMLPWDCHYRDLVSQAGHAWVAADLGADPQVVRAMDEATALSAAEDRSQPTPALLAHSDGSVAANGALGSAAAILRIGTNDVFAIVRLASADTALPSGRSEWTGLLLVLYIAKHVRGDLVVRLDNLQVVANAFMDGPWRFRRNWLRRNDRDLASLAWRLANDRQMAGLGSTTVLHQLWHPEKRKRPEQFDTHEAYNSKVDAFTHQLNDLMSLYVSFRRALHGHPTVWYEPLEEDNVGHGGCHEVTGDVYKHITASAQRRLSIERVGVKDGAFLATFGKGAIGRARSENRSTFVSKLMHEHLATEARQEMWAGRTAGSVTCGCGCVLSWAAPDEVSHGALQVDQTPGRGRRHYGLLGNDGRAHPHGGW